jgi:hypothetical protein
MDFEIRVTPKSIENKSRSSTLLQWSPGDAKTISVGPTSLQVTLCTSLMDRSLILCVKPRRMSSIGLQLIRIAASGKRKNTKKLFHYK